MRRLVPLVALISAIALGQGPAVAKHGGIHPSFRNERVYFHCSGATKVYNINRFVLGTPYLTGWDTTPPAQSFQQAGGCGGVEYGGFTNDVYDVAFQGTFAGNLRELTVEVHQLVLGNVRQTSTETLRLNAWIDGKPLFPAGTQPSNGRTVTVTPIRSSTGASEKFVFSITNIGFAREIYDEEGELVDIETGGAVLEDGEGVEEHTILLYLGVHGNTSSGDLKDKLGAWAWDASEIPSGIAFNPASLAPAKVVADLPSYP